MKSVSLLLFVSFIASQTLSAQEHNSWTKPTSGFWEEPYWSLGRLPAGDYVMFTNSGWKALAIGPSTVQANPASLGIYGMEIRADADSYNTLVLDYLGAGAPLSLNDSLFVGTNSAALVRGSGLHAGNFVLVDGTFTQTDASEVNAGSLGVGHQSAGTYHMTNSMLRATNVVLGATGYYSTNLFNQHGGATLTSNLTVRLHGRFQARAGALVSVASNVVTDGDTRFVLTNVIFRADNLTVGEWPTNNPRSAFYQVRGSHSLARSLYLETADFFLEDANLLAGFIFVSGQGHGSFHQVGGVVTATNLILLGDGQYNPFQPSLRFDGSGSYTLENGAIHTPRMQLGNEPVRGIDSHGTFEHLSGTNYADNLQVGQGQGVGTYNLKAGGLVTTNVSIWGIDATLRQLGGVHSANRIVVDGYERRAFEFYPALYHLSNGLVAAQSINIDIGTLHQQGGTNAIAGDLTLETEFSAASRYVLDDGLVTTSNTIMHSSRNGGFRQHGGTHSVTGLLDIHPPADWPSTFFGHLRYELTAGQLTTRDIRLRGGIFRHTGGTISYSGTFIMDGGIFEAAPGTHSFGRLQLLTNSTILLPSATASVLQFARSDFPQWTAGALLVIENWEGNTNGGGMHRVVFGTSTPPPGLTPTQVAQIRFRNPAGWPAGDHFARMLSTGEVVPVPRPTITYFRSGPEQFVIQWSSGQYPYKLQTSTNVTGPYTDVPGASGSSHVWAIRDEPTRFFRLQNY